VTAQNAIVAIGKKPHTKAPPGKEGTMLWVGMCFGFVTDLAYESRPYIPIPMQKIATMPTGTSGK